MSTGLFDSVKGSMIHYFVRPNDAFILNSLEKLDSDAYLYRLLREEGYERIFFIDIDETNCSVWAFDKLSYWASVKPREFAGVDLRDRNAVSSFFEKAEGSAGAEKPSKPGLDLKFTRNQPPKPSGKTVPEFGRSQMQTFATEAEFRSFMANRISPALNASNVKSAVVIPMELFEKQGYLAESTISTIRYAQKHNTAKNNIIVLTTPRRDNLANCMDFPKFRDLHYWVPEVLRSLPTGQSRVDAAVNTLRSEGILVLADQICADEIANLLLRKKLVEKDPRFAGLRIAKIHSLAERIAEHCRMEKDHFTSFKLFKMHDFIRQLDRRLDDDNVIAELVATSHTLQARPPKALDSLCAVDLERVTGQAVERYALTEAERMQDFHVAMTALDRLIGLSDVKTKLRRQLNTVRAYGGKDGPGHYVFTGNPGTGKTEVARMMGDIFKAMGLLKKGHLVECKKTDLVAEYVGASAIKTRQKCEEALDGVLFVDEAYLLVNTENSEGNFSSGFDEEAYTELMTFMDNNRHRICVIFAGYADKMKRFLEANPGMFDRIGESHIIHFPDYSADELFRIFSLFAGMDESGFRLSPEFACEIRKVIANMVKNRDANFGNGRRMRTLFDQCKECAAQRFVQTGNLELKYTLTGADIPEELYQHAAEDDVTAMAALNEMIGLASVKRQIRAIANRVRFPADRGKDIDPGHFVFVGNPGTGKTETARMIARIFKSIGVLTRDSVVEVTRNDLVAGYVGQTATKTIARCREALGGVLFVDEAYTLFAGHSGNDFGKEALDTIMKFMEDHRGRICVIFAGYEEPMKKLMEVNEGFDSRITEIIHFPDYSAEELIQIMHFMAAKQHLELADDFVEKASRLLMYRVATKTKTFGNAREVRKMLNAADGNRANRIAEAVENGQDPDSIRMNLLVAADLDLGQRASGERKISPPKKVNYHRISGASIQELPPPYGEEVFNSKVRLGAATDSAVLYIQTDTGYGTAFLISPDGYALTCHHVIAGAEKIKARFRMAGRAGGSDSWHNCEVINTKMDLDMALIKLEGQNFPYLPLASEDRVIQKGEDFILSGYPLGKRTEKDLTSFFGSIASSDKQTDDDDFIRYHISGEAKSGNSGSPVIALSDGRVIGILAGSITEQTTEILTEEINYIRPVQYFWEEFVQ